MPLDPSTLDSDTPRTLDRRSYPQHLHGYESLDSELLGLLAAVGPTPSDVFIANIVDLRRRAAARHWLASAGWRGLIDRKREGRHGPQLIALSDHGRRLLTPA